MPYKGNGTVKIYSDIIVSDNGKVTNTQEGMFHSNSPLRPYNDNYSSGSPSYCLTTKYIVNDGIPVATHDCGGGSKLYDPNELIEIYDFFNNSFLYAVYLKFQEGSTIGEETITLNFRSGTTVTPTCVWYRITNCINKYASNWKCLTGVTGTTITCQMDGVTDFYPEVIVGYPSASIPDYEYSGMSSLKEVHIGYGITEISDEVFEGCTNLKSFDYDGDISSIGYYAFHNCIALTGTFTFPPSVTIASSGVLMGCSGLTTIDLNNVTITNGNSFSNTKANILGLENLTSISNSFVRTSGLTSCNFNSLENISGRGIFSGSSVTELHFPNVLSASTTTCLAYMPNVTGITFGSLTSTTLPTSCFAYCPNLVVIKGLESITSISNYCFCGDKSLKMTGTHDIYGYDMSQMLTSIGNYSFQNCSAITNEIFTLNSGITSIGTNAFQNCTSLTSINFSSGITSIGASAFSGCSSIASYNFTKTTPPSIGSGTTVFSGITDYWWIYPPYGSYASYTGGTYWSTYKPHIHSATTEYSIQATYNLVSGQTYNLYRASAGTSYITGAIRLSDGTQYSTLTAYTANATGLVTFEIGTNSAQTMNGGFSGCTELTKIVCGNGITKLGASTFRNCTNLKTFEGNGVVNIQNYCFRNCRVLTNCETNAISVLGSSGYMFADCGNLATLPNLSSNLSGIPASAFSGCTSLTDLDLNIGTGIIGNYAFNGCTGLESVSISGQTSGVSSYAFSGCTSIKTLTLGANMKQLNSRAFGFTSSLEEIYLYCPTAYGSGEISNATSPFFGVKTSGTVYYDQATYNSYVEGHSGVTVGSSSVYYPGEIFLYSGTSATTYNLKYYGWNASILKNAIYYSGSTYIPTSIVSSINSVISSTGPQVVSSSTNYITSVSGITGRWYTLYFDRDITYLPDYLFSSSSPLSSSTYNIKGVLCPKFVNTFNNNCFYGNTMITKVYGFGTMNVGTNCFSGCTNLTTMQLAASLLNKVGECCFANTKVASLFYDRNYKISYRCYYQNSGLTSINDSHVISVGMEAFYGSLLSTASFSVLQDVGQRGFSKSQLSTFYYPESCIQFGEWAFEYCENLTSVTFNAASLLEGNSVVVGVVKNAGSNGDYPIISCVDIQSSLAGVLDTYETYKSASTWYGEYYHSAVNSGLKGIYYNGVTDKYSTSYIAWSD